MVRWGGEIKRINGHTFGTPNHGYPKDRLDEFSTSGKYNESGKHDCTCPKPRYILPKSRKLDWLGIQCKDPWCGFGKWRNCQRRCPKPTKPRRSIFWLQTLKKCQKISLGFGYEILTRNLDFVTFSFLHDWSLRMRASRRLDQLPFCWRLFNRL